MSQERKWVPGPWESRAAARDGFWVSAKVAPYVVVETEDIEGHYGAVIGDANAHLIAAAPDLYEALEAAIECGLVPSSTAKNGGAPSFARQVHVADMIRAALAKARGEA